MSEKGGNRVYLVYSVCLVYLVSRIGTNQRNQTDQRNQINRMNQSDGREPYAALLAAFSNSS